MTSLFENWRRRKCLREASVSPWIAGHVSPATSVPGLTYGQSSLWYPSPYPHFLPPTPPISYHIPTPTSYRIPSNEVSPVWMSGSGLNDSDEQLLLNYLGSSVRESTRKCYTSYWNRFKTFCVQRRVNSLPAAPAVVARFLIFIAEANASVSGAKSAVSAISYFHKMFMGDATPPTDSFVVKSIVKSLTEKFAKPVKKATPFSSLNLKQLLDYFYSLDCVTSDCDLSLVIMIAVMFCLMARFEEISKLTTDCINVLDSGDVEVTFPSAKNYNFSNSKKSYLAFCPQAQYNIASIFSCYVSSLVPGSLLFPFNYASALAKVRILLSKANLNASFSLHSFRVGAVSEAVNGGLISDSDVQRHARWNSIEMLYRYRCQTLDSQLKASRILLISRL